MQRTNFIKSNIQNISSTKQTTKKKLNTSYQKYLRTSLKESLPKKSIIKTSRGPIHINTSKQDSKEEFWAESGGSGLHGGGS